MPAFDDAERLEVGTLEEWSAWLEANHEREAGVWLVMWKKSSGRQAFTHDDAVTEALRVGWIDAIRRSLDGDRSIQWFVRRRKRSTWSSPNRERIARLEAEGRMLPAGIAAVERAKAEGTWMPAGRHPEA